jgi:hydrogenase maturation protease
VTGPRAVVIGVGNEFRRDDGVGPALVAALQPHDLPGVALVVSDGEPTQLLDAWAGVPLAVVVDAVVCEPAQPGRIHRTGVADLPAAAVSSTHGLGIPEAVRLGEAVDRAPQRLLIYGVEAGDVSYGAGLSDAVARALPELVRAVLAELDPPGSTPPG